MTKPVILSGKPFECWQSFEDMAKDCPAHEIISSLIYSQMADFCFENGYLGHYFKFKRKSEEQFKDRKIWLKYLEDVLGIHEDICLSYTPVKSFDTIEDLYICLLGHYSYTCERLYYLLVLAQDSEILDSIEIIRNQLNKSLFAKEFYSGIVDYLQRENWCADSLSEIDRDYYNQFK